MPTQAEQLQPHEPFGRHLQPGAGCHFSLRGTQAAAHERYRWWDDGFRPDGVTFRITFTAAGVTQFLRDELLRVVSREDGWFRFFGSTAHWSNDQCKPRVAYDGRSCVIWFFSHMGNAVDTPVEIAMKLDLQMSQRMRQRNKCGCSLCR
eukprot:s2927_g1.t1